MQVDITQLVISTATIYGITMLWNNLNETLFRTVLYLAKTPFTVADADKDSAEKN